MSNITLTRGIGFGVIGSLAGTIVMDLSMIVGLMIMELPADSYFALFGTAMGDGVLLGVALHYLTGLIWGVVFGVLVSRIDALRIDTVGKGVGLGLLLGIVTVPVVLPLSMMLDIPILTLLSFSLVLHPVWGVVLGAIAGYGLRSAVISAREYK